MGRGLLEIEAALQARFHAQQDAVVRPAQVMVPGQVNGDAVFGFYSRWLENLPGRRLCRHWRQNPGSSQFCHRWRQNLEVGKKPAHVPKAASREASPVLLRQLRSQGFDQAFAVACPLGVPLDVLGDDPSHVPVKPHQGQVGGRAWMIDIPAGCGRVLAPFFNDRPAFLIPVSARANPGWRPANPGKRKCSWKSPDQPLGVLASTDRLTCPRIAHRAEAKVRPTRAR